jgi:hypothetical protein
MAKQERFGNRDHFISQSTLHFFDLGFGELEHQLTQAVGFLQCSEGP